MLIVLSVPRASCYLNVAFQNNSVVTKMLRCRSKKRHSYTFSRYRTERHKRRFVRLCLAKNNPNLFWEVYPLLRKGRKEVGVRESKIFDNYKYNC